MTRPRRRAGRLRQDQRDLPRQRAAAGRRAVRGLHGRRHGACTGGRRATAACGRSPARSWSRDPDVQVVLCLTPPDYHAEVMLQAIAAGKHVYTEKPLATSVDDARWVLSQAAGAGVLVGSAPDTFLGAGIQTVKQAIDDGVIGAPAVAQIRLLAGPPESWHPSPAFLYAELSGPLMDLGPYAVATAIELFGPVASVTALATMPRTAGRDARRRRVPDRRADPRRGRARPRERRPDDDHHHRRRQRPGALRRRGPRPRRLAARRRPEHVRRAGRSSPAAASSTRRCRSSSSGTRTRAGSASRTFAAPSVTGRRSARAAISACRSSRSSWRCGNMPEQRRIARGRGPTRPRARPARA